MPDANYVGAAYLSVINNFYHINYMFDNTLHECLTGTGEIKIMIMKKSLVEDLRTQALSDGMTTLKQDGIYKVFKGDCDLKQVLAVCIV